MDNPQTASAHPLAIKEASETWVSGSRLTADEQRYVLALFPESRLTLKLSEAQWLGQTEFRLKKDGSLDLRSLYCRLPAQGNEPRRYHRAPRYQPLPPPPQRQSATPAEPDLVAEYREELIAKARHRYPDADSELAAKLDREINRRVELLRGYQDQLVQAIPTNATPDERGAFLENIKQHVQEYRQALEKDIRQQRERRQQQREQAQQQTLPHVLDRRQQQRGMGIDR